MFQRSWCLSLLLIWFSVGQIACQKESTAEVRFAGLIDAVFQHPTEYPGTVYALMPNLSDVEGARKALNRSDCWMQVHEPKLVIDPNDFESLPPGIFVPDPCRGADGLWSTSLRGKHLDLGENIPLPVHANREPIKQDHNGDWVGDPGSVNWLTGTTTLLEQHESGSVDAQYYPDLLYEEYGGTGFRRMISRVAIHSGQIEIDGFFQQGGDNVEYAFRHSKHPKRYLGRHLVARYDTAMPTLRIRNLESRDNEGATLVFKDGISASVMIENHPARCGQVEDRVDFIAHFLLRQWPESTPMYPYPRTTGTGPYNNPQCSPSDNQWP